MSPQTLEHRILAHQSGDKPRDEDRPAAIPAEQKAVGFSTPEIAREEQNRRVMAEAHRLAALTPGEWRLWINASAERLKRPP